MHAGRKSLAVARDAGRGAMSREEVRRFVEHYLPVYRAYQARPHSWALACTVDLDPSTAPL